MDEWVFVDTCIWASFFGKPGSPEKAAVDDLLEADRVALVGTIVAEVLLGFRRKDQADWVASRLQLAHYVEADWEDWRAAADLGQPPPYVVERRQSTANEDDARQHAKDRCGTAGHPMGMNDYGRRSHMHAEREADRDDGEQSERPENRAEPYPPAQGVRSHQALLAIR